MQQGLLPGESFAGGAIAVSDILARVRPLMLTSHHNREGLPVCSCVCVPTETSKFTYLDRKVGTWMGCAGLVVGSLRANLTRGKKYFPEFKYCFSHTLYTLYSHQEQHQTCLGWATSSRGPRLRSWCRTSDPIRAHVLRCGVHWNACRTHGTDELCSHEIQSPSTGRYDCSHAPVD